MTADQAVWTRPENINGPRPFYYVPVKDGTSDLLGQLIGAFAASAPLFKTIDPAYYAQLMTMAQALYGVMISAPSPHFLVQTGRGLPLGCPHAGVVVLLLSCSFSGIAESRVG